MNQLNRIESREIDPDVYEQLIFDTFSGENRYFQQIVLEQLDIYMQNSELYLYLTSYKKF